MTIPFALGMADLEAKLVELVEFLLNNPPYLAGVLIALPLAVVLFSRTSTR